MAILNEDALDAIYILIGNTAKMDADEKKEDYKLFLFVASYIAIPVGLFLLILVPGIGLFFVSDSYTHFGYYVPGIVVIILGIVFIIINVTKFNRKKKTDDFDFYAYGKEHIQEYPNDKNKKKSYNQIKLNNVITLFDNLVSAELLSSETGTRYIGRSRLAVAYTTYNYRLTYEDGTVETKALNDAIDFYRDSIRILKCYLPSNSEEQENN